MKTEVRKSVKDIVEEVQGAPKRLQVVASARDVSPTDSEDKPRGTKVVRRVDERRGRIVKVATLTRIDLKGNRMLKSTDRKTKVGFVPRMLRAPISSTPTATMFLANPLGPTTRPVGRPRKVPLEEQQPKPSPRNKMDGVKVKVEPETKASAPAKAASPRRRTRLGSKPEKKTVCVPKTKQVHTRHARKLLEKAKKGPGRPSAPMAKDGDGEGSSTTPTPHHRKQFVLPLKSSRSSRVIKPNKRFMQVSSWRQLSAGVSTSCSFG